MPSSTVLEFNNGSLYEKLPIFKFHGNRSRFLTGKYLEEKQAETVYFVVQQKEKCLKIVEILSEQQ